MFGEYDKDMSKKSLEFHIASDDYFGTLATVLDLLRQSRSGRELTKQDEKALIVMRDDLVYLQAHYKIVKKGSRTSTIIPKRSSEKSP